MMVKHGEKINPMAGKYIVTCMVALLVLMSVSACTTEKSYGTDEEVTLAGHLTLETFKDANDKPEQSYILTLGHAINVGKDDFGGPDLDVKKVQLVVFSDSGIDIDKYLDRNLTLSGTLFHSHTAHHHTKVLLEVKELIK